MKLRHSRHPARPGFTLIEILIVLVIILILAGLLAAAVSRALTKAKEVRNRAEISQLAGALETFKQKFGFYPPSRLAIAEQYPRYNLNNPEHSDSIQVLTRMFPRIDLGGWSGVGIDWDGNGQIQTTVITLEGDQCLVFFLGGIPGGGGISPTRPGLPTCHGFSANPRNPADATTADRIGPFFEFQAARLVDWPRPFGVGGNFFWAYLDVYLGQPYAYFSSYKTTNGYNRYGNSDCPSMLTGLIYPNGNPVPLMPYYEALPSPGAPAGKFLNPNSFQIISAGKNVLFGPGGTNTATGPIGPWSAPTASTFYPDFGPGDTGIVAGSIPDRPTTRGGVGRDDQSNFYDSLLGVETR